MTAFRLELRRSRGLVLWLGITMLVYGGIMGLMHPVLKQNDDLMRQYMEVFPKEFLAMFGMSGTLSDPGVFFTTYIASWLWPIIAAVAALLLGTRAVAADLDRGFLDLPLSTRMSRARYLGASILLVRVNFGCGSSREHAPWALQDCGFRALIGESFADIFFNNCYKNGVLPIVLPKAEIDALFGLTEFSPGFRLKIDLPAQMVVRPDGHMIPFEIDLFRKESLVNGWDEIGLTLRHAEKIREFEERRKRQHAWLFV